MHLRQDEKTLRQLTKAHWSDLIPSYQSVGIERLERIRQNLCIDVELLDPNTDVHTMLRLTRGETRLELEGRIGGAMYIRTMAEMLRRAAEQVYSVELREEDELGFGWTPPNMKMERYGVNRLLDGDQTAANAFLRAYKLDYSVRLHWYVEGETEYYAFTYALEEYGVEYVKVVNLGGQVVHRGVLAFQANLRKDLEQDIYSYISIDADNVDNVRAVRKAMEADLICGLVYIAKPDFEFDNFTLAELEEVLWEIAQEKGADPITRSHLHNAITGANSGEELLKRAQRALPELREVGKGKEWGVHLMIYAQRHRGRADGMLRPIVDAFENSIRSRIYDYHIERAEFRIDPQTGRPIPRNSASAT